MGFEALAALIPSATNWNPPHQESPDISGSGVGFPDLAAEPDHLFRANPMHP